MLRAILNLRNTACPTIIQKVVLAFVWGCVWTFKRAQTAITVRGWMPPFHDSEVASLCKAVTTNYPFKKVLELGINLGQVMDVLSWVLPDVKFVGVSDDVAKIFRLRPFAQTRTNVEVVQEELHNLRDHADGTFDVSYTCGVLSYCDKKEATQILKELRRVTSGSIFLLELQDASRVFSDNGVEKSQNCTQFYDTQGNTNLWVRDYVKFVAEVLGSKSGRVTCSKVKRPLWDNMFWRNYGAVVVIE